jgi:hypothetical protein
MNKPQVFLLYMKQGIYYTEMLKNVEMLFHTKLLEWQMLGWKDEVFV